MRSSETGPLAHPEAQFQRIALELLSARVRMRALLELLEEKGVLAPDEFDRRARDLWEQDYEALAAAFLATQTKDEERGSAPPPSFGRDRVSAKAALQNILDEAIGARVRLRTLAALLEERGVLQPGELEAKADAIWDRDYEELTLEFYRMHF